MIWETKGLTLEQVDRMMEEVGSPRHSAGWQPHSTFAHDMGMDGTGKQHVGNAATGNGPSHQEGVEKAYISAGGAFGGGLR